MRSDGMGERVNGEREQNEECEPPKQSKNGFIYLHGIKEPHGLPQEAHVTDILH
jgi:hypothetical protein